jgi:uncharacterized protein YbcI
MSGRRDPPPGHAISARSWTLAWRGSPPVAHLPFAAASLPFCARFATGARKGPSVSKEQEEVLPPGAPQHDGGGRHHSASMAISNEMVRLYKDQFGRGPTKARTTWGGSDLVTVVLEDTLTLAERNLIKMGEHQRLRDLRLFFQYASVREFCEPVERITGRKVRAFISGIDTEADGLATEMFLLHPEGYDGPSRIERAEL